MNKHRVVGFIVVIGLIVIVTEFLLNYRMQSATATVETVQPPMPELVKNTNSINISEPEAVSITSNTIKSSKQTEQKQEYKPRPVTTEATKQIARGNPANPDLSKSNSASAYSHAWVVQLASYSDQAHADNLVSKLRKNGFDAFSYQAVSHGKKYIRVNAGPVATSTAAKQLMAKLSNEMKLKGYLVQYRPTDDLKQQNNASASNHTSQ